MTSIQQVLSNLRSKQARCVILDSDKDLRYLAHFMLYLKIRPVAQAAKTIKTKHHA